MTEQEAIEAINNECEKTFLLLKCSNEFAEALAKSIGALEKQIPKKWQYEMVNDDDTYVCPCCKEYWFMDYGNPTTNEYNYCPNCGQALKWE